MPIHISWKKMASGMRKTYCGKKDGKGGGPECRKFTDGVPFCMCKKAWSVFFATLNKKGWKDTKPRPKSVTETVFLEAVEDTMTDILHWYEETLSG